MSEGNRTLIDNNFRVKRLTDVHVFNILGIVIVSVFAFFCLIPFLFVVSGSFTDESTIYSNGYQLIPEKWSLEAYNMVFKAPTALIRSYIVTIVLTGAGTFIGLFITSMTGYVLSRPDFRYRNQIAFFFYFTTLFNGGLVATYILMISYLGMKNNYMALLLPGLLNVFYILIMRNFAKSIPSALVESAKIDGAGEIRVFLQIILPLMVASLASIGLFIALYYWNNWYNAMLYIQNQNMFPLQYLLYKMINSVRFAAMIAAESGVSMPDMPQHSLKLAMTCVVTGPIIFVYPFIQKYFIKGITIGSVKG